MGEENFETERLDISLGALLQKGANKWIKNLRVNVS